MIAHRYGTPYARHTAPSPAQGSTLRVLTLLLLVITLGFVLRQRDSQGGPFFSSLATRVRANTMRVR